MIRAAVSRSCELFWKHFARNQIIAQWEFSIQGRKPYLESKQELLDREEFSFLRKSVLLIKHF